HPGTRRRGRASDVRASRRLLTEERRSSLPRRKHTVEARGRAVSPQRGSSVDKAAPVSGKGSGLGDLKDSFLLAPGEMSERDAPSSRHGLSFIHLSLAASALIAGVTPLRGNLIPPCQKLQLGQ